MEEQDSRGSSRERGSNAEVMRVKTKERIAATDLARAKVTHVK